MFLVAWPWLACSSRDGANVEERDLTEQFP